MQALMSARSSASYYNHEQAALWGKDLYEHLADVFTDNAVPGRDANYAI